jgi:hypothetical protein
MMNWPLKEGCRVQDGTLSAVQKMFPEGTVEDTKGTHYSLSEQRKYVVRLGQKTVIMPAMKFSDSAAAAFQKLYEREK